MPKVRQHTCCNKKEVKMGTWSPYEDEILRNYVLTKGHDNWAIVPRQAGLRRCVKSCRLRWLNYLNPDLKRGPISDDESRLIIQLQELVGNKWSYIATHLPGRTDNEIKNFWNSTLKKRVLSLERNQQNHNAPIFINNNLPSPQQLQLQLQLQQHQQQFHLNLFYSLKQRFFDSAVDRLIDNHDNDFANDHVAQDQEQVVMVQPAFSADQSLIVQPDDDMPSDDLIKECLQAYNHFFPSTS